MNQTKEKLIEIAIETIQKSGIHKLTMRDLGKAVNIKSSSVLYHFKSKNGLLMEVVNVYGEKFFDSLNEIDSLYKDPRERLDKLIEMFEIGLNSDRLCLFGMLASEGENLDEMLKEETKKFFLKLEGWLESNLLLIKQDKNLAKVIVSSLEGAILVDKLESKNIHLEAIRKWIKSL